MKDKEAAATADAAAAVAAASSAKVDAAVGAAGHPSLADPLLLTQKVSFTSFCNHVELTLFWLNFPHHVLYV